MNDTLGNVLDIIFELWWLWILIFIVIFIFKIMYSRKNGLKFEEFDIPELKDITRKGLSEKFNLFGIKLKDGRIYRSFQEIAKVKRFFEANGTFDDVYFDRENKEMYTYQLKARPVENNGNETTEENEDTEGKHTYDLLFVEAHNKFFLFRWLGIKPIYFILKNIDNENRSLLVFNPQTASITLSAKTNLTPYGGAWTNCESGIETINDISMIRLNERLQALLDSTPDKYVHLEMQQAKLERRVKILTEAEKSKYKEKEEAGDTTIV